MFVISANSKLTLWNEDAVVKVVAVPVCPKLGHVLASALPPAAVPRPCNLAYILIVVPVL